MIACPDFADGSISHGDVDTVLVHRACAILAPIPPGNVFMSELVKSEQATP